MSDRRVLGIKRHGGNSFDVRQAMDERPWVTRQSGWRSTTWAEFRDIGANITRAMANETIRGVEDRQKAIDMVAKNELAEETQRVDFGEPDNERRGGGVAEVRRTLP